MFYLNDVRCTIQGEQHSYDFEFELIERVNYASVHQTKQSNLKKINSIESLEEINRQSFQCLQAHN